MELWGDSVTEELRKSEQEKSETWLYPRVESKMTNHATLIWPAIAGEWLSKWLKKKFLKRLWKRLN